MAPKILIVEDDVIIAEFIKDILEENNYNSVTIANDYETAVSEMQNFVPDLILMDINLNGLNSGIELAEKKNENAKVIFLTGQNDHGLMSKALTTSPESYLTKPLKKNDLIAAIQLSILKNKPSYVVIKDGTKTIKIDLNEILFAKSENIYVDIQTTTKKYTIRKSLDTFLKELNNSNFIKVHRSYVINTIKITSKKTTSVFIEKYEIPISRNTNLEL
ncbi:LytR/AlgR family response regulator transcription factor [Flavobacterium lacisediminis]|uniref:Response regulator transcription factor n=1 Tax=Flavobacterium lacisediminis TaxID=2989705 RepID=A0ABT3EHM1_9FLAO|nr:response regulator transcription factor [Flavobacterium lacisediminis]MCW1147584.1 response regulator transcription factor [Flavobacterium lacisediminis]